MRRRLGQNPPTPQDQPSPVDPCEALCFLQRLAYGIASKTLHRHTLRSPVDDLPLQQSMEVGVNKINDERTGVENLNIKQISMIMLLYMFVMEHN